MDVIDAVSAASASKRRNRPSMFDKFVLAGPHSV